MRVRTRHFLLFSFLCATLLGAAEKKAVHPEAFPKGRPFSPGILYGDTLYVAGMVGNDLKTGQAPESFEDEVKQCLENINLVLKGAGMDFKNAVSVNVYLTDMDLFQRMNEVYVKYFPEPRPVRTTVGVNRLAGKYRLEITVTARR